MTPANFPQANATLHPPSGYDESQCATIPAFQGRLLGGSLDGSNVVVVAWQPSPEDIEDIKNGNLVFLMCIGGIPPHTLTTRFPE